MIFGGFPSAGNLESRPNRIAMLPSTHTFPCRRRPDVYTDVVLVLTSVCLNYTPQAHINSFLVNLTFSQIRETQASFVPIILLPSKPSRSLYRLKVRPMHLQPLVLCFLHFRNMTKLSKSEADIHCRSNPCLCLWEGRRTPARCDYPWNRNYIKNRDC